LIFGFLELEREKLTAIGTVCVWPLCSHVLAAYASFLWEQDDDDDLGEGEQGAGGAGAPDQYAARAQQAGQVRELASAAV
jgi:hypothetical protein